MPPPEATVWCLTDDVDAADQSCRVRRYRPDDLEAVRDLCFATGVMGDGAEAQMADRDTFAHLFCDWYLLERPDSCWVLDDVTAGDGAGDGVGGRGVVGYLLGSPDGGGRSEMAHQRRVFTRHLLGRGMVLRPSTMKFFVRSVVDLFGDRRALASPVDEVRFPAELHTNLAQGVRGRGLGSMLMTAYLDQLADLGVPGVHLSTFGENSGGIAFFRSMGFREVGDAVPNPGFRMPDGSRCTVRRFCREVA